MNSPSLDKHWRDDSACRGAGLEEFIVDQPNEDAQQTAAKYCALCPVQESCTVLAELLGVQGIWGGQWYPGPGSERKHPVPLLEDAS